MTVRCLICDAPGAWICERKHEDDESERADLARILAMERTARDGATVMTVREAEVLARAATALLGMGLSPAAILSRALLAEVALRGMSEDEALAAIERPGELDPIFAPSFLRGLVDARRAASRRNPVKAGGRDVDLSEEVPLVALLGRVADPRGFLRRAAAAIALGKHSPRARTALDYNADAHALRVAKKVQEALASAHRSAPKSARSAAALVPFVRAAGVPEVYSERLASDLSAFRRRACAGASLRVLAALFLSDSKYGSPTPRSGAPSLQALRVAEAELDRLEKLPTTTAVVVGSGPTDLAGRSAHERERATHDLRSGKAPRRPGSDPSSLATDREGAGLRPARVREVRKGLLLAGRDRELDHREDLHVDQSRDPGTGREKRGLRRRSPCRREKPP